MIAFVLAASMCMTLSMSPRHKVLKAYMDINIYLPSQCYCRRPGCRCLLRHPMFNGVHITQRVPLIKFDRAFVERVELLPKRSENAVLIYTVGLLYAERGIYDRAISTLFRALRLGDVRVQQLSALQLAIIWKGMRRTRQHLMWLKLHALVKHREIRWTQSQRLAFWRIIDMLERGVDFKYKYSFSWHQRRRTTYKPFEKTWLNAWSQFAYSPMPHYKDGIYLMKMSADTFSIEGVHLR